MIDTQDEETGFLLLNSCKTCILAERKLNFIAASSGQRLNFRFFSILKLQVCVELLLL